MWKVSESGDDSNTGLRCYSCCSCSFSYIRFKSPGPNRRTIGIAFQICTIKKSIFEK